MFNTTYKSDINPQVLENFFIYINQVNNHYKSFVNGYATAIPTQDVMDAIGSPLSCFFNEYLARKFNKQHSAVTTIDNHFHGDLKNKLLKHFNQELEIVINITSGTYAIVCALLTLIQPGDKVLVLDSCCGGYWSQGSKSFKGLEGYPALLFEIQTFHLNNNFQFDYYQLEETLIAQKPQCLLLGFSAYTQLIDYKKIRQLCNENNCFFIADVAHTIGLMLTKIIPHCFMDAHITVGSTYKTIKGPRGGLMITPHSEYLTTFQNHLTSIQVERGANLVAGAYIAINHCWENTAKNALGKSIAIAQEIYNYFNQDQWKLFNITPLMATSVPMVLLDLGYDATAIINTLLECGCHCSGFMIHGKYVGLRIVTTNMDVFTPEEIKEMLNLFRTIFLNKNINWSMKEKIKQNIKSIVNKYSYGSTPEIYDKTTMKYINSIIKKQNDRIIFSTCSLFTDMSIKLQGNKLMAIDLDSFAFNDDHPSSPYVMKKKIQEKTSKHIKFHLKLPHNIYSYYNIPSAGAAILASLLTLAHFNDKILIVAENNGGHYTQGSMSSSGVAGLPKTLYNVKEFFINQDNTLDLDILENNLRNFQPKVLLLGFSSYGGLFDFKKIRQLCDQYNCFFIADCSHNIGLMISGMIPNCFDEAHMTVASTYKTIPAVRGGLMMTKNFNLYKEFQKKSNILCPERGLNLMAAMAIGIEECLTTGYRKKMENAMAIVKTIENFFIEHNLGKPTVASQVHMATIDCGFDIREIFTIIMECHLDIGTFYVPHTDRYGLRFICATVGILSYSSEDIMKILLLLKLILIKKNSIAQEEKDYIKKEVIKIAHKYPLYKEI
jgi:glycine/serine hydroxymethyltransferase